MKNLYSHLSLLVIVSFLSTGCYTQFQTADRYEPSSWAQERYGDEVLNDYSLAFRDYNRFRQHAQFNTYLGISNWSPMFSPFGMGATWMNPYWSHLGGFGYVGFHDWLWYQQAGFFGVGSPFGFYDFFMADLAFYNGWRWGGINFGGGALIPSYVADRSYNQTPQRQRASGRTGTTLYNPAERLSTYGVGNASDIRTRNAARGINRPNNADYPSVLRTRNSSSRTQNSARNVESRRSNTSTGNTSSGSSSSSRRSSGRN